MAQTKQEFLQQLTINLRGGQTLTVPFHAESGTVLNPQIEEFFKILSDKNKQDAIFVFQGSRVVLVRIADVSTADVIGLVRKENNGKSPTDK